MRRDRGRLGLRECRAAWLLGLTVREYQRLEAGEDDLIVAEVWERMVIYSAPAGSSCGPMRCAGTTDAALRLSYLIPLRRLTGDQIRAPAPAPQESRFTPLYRLKPYRRGGGGRHGRSRS
jgi:hypothetical protein